MINGRVDRLLLRESVAGLPVGTGITLIREILLDVLDDALPAGSKVAPLPAPPPGGDQFLSAPQVAARIGCSRRWCYDHWRELGGVRLSRRCLRFSEAAVAKFLARKLGS